MADLEESGSYDIGLIGLGVMGSNFALNIADHGFSVVGYKRAEEAEITIAQASRSWISPTSLHHREDPAMCRIDLGAKV